MLCVNFAVDILLLPVVVVFLDRVRVQCEMVITLGACDCVYCITVTNRVSAWKLQYLLRKKRQIDAHIK